MTTRVKSIEPAANGTQVPDKGQHLLIEPIRPKILDITIEGLTPLVVNAWSKKAIQMMIAKQTGKHRQKKEAKDPEKDYLESLYMSKDGWTGIPAGGMKGCLVNACRVVEGLPMTLAKRIIFVESQGISVAHGKQLVRVNGTHHIHEEMVRIDGGKTADIHFRAMYELPWEIRFDVTFLENIVSAEQMCNLIELAGYVEGLCEHRPGSPYSNTGDRGRFRIKRSV